MGLCPTSKPLSAQQCCVQNGGLRPIGRGSHTWWFRAAGHGLVDAKLEGIYEVAGVYVQTRAKGECLILICIPNP